MRGGSTTCPVCAKNWSTRTQWPKATGAKPEYVSLGEGFLKLHPCAQVQGYRDYLQRYAAALVDYQQALALLFVAEAVDHPGGHVVDRQVRRRRRATA